MFGHHSHPIGNIPAHAERTFQENPLPSYTRKHPCSRRANRYISVTISWQKETSLLTQSELAILTLSLKYQRNIPAHAERTSHQAENFKYNWKHPCSRRANQRPVSSLCFTIETSLLTQSELMYDEPDDVCKRNIPAHAERTGPLLGILRIIWKHPCSRRANEKYHIIPYRPLETSLLTQSEPRYARLMKPSKRNIPAHAERTM